MTIDFTAENSPSIQRRVIALTKPDLLNLKWTIILESFLASQNLTLSASFGKGISEGLREDCFARKCLRQQNERRDFVNTSCQQVLQLKMKNVSVDKIWRCFLLQELFCELCFLCLLQIQRPCLSTEMLPRTFGVKDDENIEMDFCTNPGQERKAITALQRLAEAALCFMASLLDWVKGEGPWWLTLLQSCKTCKSYRWANKTYLV